MSYGWQGWLGQWRFQWRLWYGIGRAHEVQETAGKGHPLCHCRPHGAEGRVPSLVTRTVTDRAVST